ncbi:MAG: methyltransferase family protein [Vulcanimicrobiaceae bacterium]
MREPGRIIPPEPPVVDPSDPRSQVFKNRGALLALPALALVAFGRPSAFSIAVGLPVAFAGELMRCWAVGYSGESTRDDRVVAPRLVTAGPYAHVRNPLYLGNFATALGFSIAFTGRLRKRQRMLLAVFGLGTMAAVYATIVPLEEAYLRRKFGAAFDAYCERVPPYLPSGVAAGDGEGTYDVTVIANAESRTFASFGGMLLALAVKALRA